MKDGETLEYVAVHQVGLAMCKGVLAGCVNNKLDLEIVVGNHLTSKPAVVAAVDKIDAEHSVGMSSARMDSARIGSGSPDRIAAEQVLDRVVQSRTAQVALGSIEEYLDTVLQPSLHSCSFHRSQHYVADTAVLEVDMVPKQVLRRMTEKGHGIAAHCTAEAHLAEGIGYSPATDLGNLGSHTAAGDRSGTHKTEEADRRVVAVLVGHTADFEDKNHMGAAVEEVLVARMFERLAQDTVDIAVAGQHHRDQVQTHIVKDEWGLHSG